MSIPSYRRNVWLWVTGQDTDTCFPAALEQISPYCHLSPDTYKTYERFIHGWARLKKKDPWAVNPRYKDLIGQIAWELGGVDFDEVEFERANTYREFSIIVRKLLRHDYRVAIDLHLDEYGYDIAHPVGLIPLEDGESFKVVSNWVPSFLRGAVTLREVFENIDFQPALYRQRFPFNDSNITALPPKETFDAA